MTKSHGKYYNDRFKKRRGVCSINIYFIIKVQNEVNNITRICTCIYNKQKKNTKRNYQSDLECRDDEIFLRLISSDFHQTNIFLVTQFMSLNPHMSVCTDISVIPIHSVHTVKPQSQKPMICKSYHHPLRIHLGISLLHTSNNLVHKKSGCPIFISFWRSILVNMDAVLGSLVISHSGLYVLLCLLLRTWRIIPAKSWSTLWFSATDVSMYLQLYLVATFLASSD